MPTVGTRDRRVADSGSRRAGAGAAAGAPRGAPAPAARVAAVGALRRVGPERVVRTVARGRLVGRSRLVVGAAVLVVAVAYLAGVLDVREVAVAAGAVASAPATVLAALLAYAGAFGLRALAWCRVLPGLGAGQSWAALHVSLLGNHVLPLRLGEVLRVTSVLRRTDLAPGPVVASAVTLRLGDLLGLLVVAVAATPALLATLVGAAWSVALAVVIAVGGLAGVAWCHRLARERRVRVPGPAVATATLAAWLLEAVVLLAVADAAGLPLTWAEAAGVTAVTVLAQTVAPAPGGFGTYEAAGTAALVALGLPAGPALAVVLVTHGVKTAYALVLGGPALWLPGPGYWGRWRLPRRLPGRPPVAAVPHDAPVVAFLPAHDEEDAIAGVLGRLPRTVHGRRVEVVVVDDGSTDATAERAAAAGADVVRVASNRGLGAAVRRGLAEAVARGPRVRGLPRRRRRVRRRGPRRGGRPRAGRRRGLRRGQPVRRPDRGDAPPPPRRQPGPDGVGAVDDAPPRPSPTARAATGPSRPPQPPPPRSCTTTTTRRCSPSTCSARASRTARCRSATRSAASGTSFVRLGRYLRAVVPAVHRQLNPAGTATRDGG